MSVPMSLAKATDAVLRIDATSWGRISHSPRARAGRGWAKAKIVLYVARYTYGAGRPSVFLALSRRKLHAECGVHLREAGELVDELVAERVLERARDLVAGRVDAVRLNPEAAEWRVPWLPSVLHVERPEDLRETDRAVGEIARETGRAVKTDTARDGSRGEVVEPRDAFAVSARELSISSSESSHSHSLREGGSDDAERQAAPLLAAIEAKTPIFGRPRQGVVAMVAGLTAERIDALAAEVKDTRIATAAAVVAWLEPRVRGAAPSASSTPLLAPRECSRCHASRRALIGPDRLCPECYERDETADFVTVACENAGAEVNR